MKKLCVALALVAFAIGGQMAVAAEKAAVTDMSVCDAKSASALTVTGDMASAKVDATTAKCTSGTSGSIPVVDWKDAKVSTSVEAKPAKTQINKSKSNVKNN